MHSGMNRAAGVAKYYWYLKPLAPNKGIYPWRIPCLILMVSGSIDYYRVCVHVLHSIVLCCRPCVLHLPRLAFVNAPLLLQDGCMHIVRLCVTGTVLQPAHRMPCVFSWTISLHACSSCFLQCSAVLVACCSQDRTTGRVAERGRDR